jgi:hypothetical protein
MAVVRLTGMRRTTAINSRRGFLLQLTGFGCGFGTCHICGALRAYQRLWHSRQSLTRDAGLAVRAGRWRVLVCECPALLTHPPQPASRVPRPVLVRRLWPAIAPRPVHRPLQIRLSLHGNSRQLVVRTSQVDAASATSASARTDSVQQQADQCQQHTSRQLGTQRSPRGGASSDPIVHGNSREGQGAHQ